jgi:ABC-2 type transport system permease protein
MRRLIHAELCKLSSTLTSRLLVPAAMLLTALFTVITVASQGHAEGVHTLSSSSGLQAVLNAAAPAELFSLILGILSVAGERRWGTEVSTFLVTPRRERVLGAKLVVGAALGTVLGICCCAVTLAIAHPMLAGDGVSLPVTGSATLQVFGGIVLVSTLYGAIGVGLGALIPSQTIAVTAALIWSLVIENGAIAAWTAGGRWLPGGAAAAVTRATLPYGSRLLHPGAAIVLLIAYGIGFALVGTARMARRAVA